MARDITRIEAEIMAENFEPSTLLAMSQVDDVPTDEAIGQQIAQITQQVQQMAADPQIVAQAQTPEGMQQAQQILQQAQAEVQRLENTVTVEKIVAMLREQRVRPFVLEIETDSTIQPDEDAAKQRATEMVTAVGGYMSQAFPLVQAMPEAAPVAAEFLKFIASQFRAGRQMDGVIDEFADKMKEIASQPRGPDPAQVAAEAEAKQAEADAAMRKQESDQRMAEIAAEAPVKQAEANARLAEIKAKSDAFERQARLEMVLNAQKVRLGELQIEAAEVTVQRAKSQPKQEAA